MIIELTLDRLWHAGEKTLGLLYWSGLFQCYTLEDTVREKLGEDVANWKIPERTAIPAGRYRLDLVNSPRFGPETPTLLDVPGFSSIRIHAGNDENDTEGCILVGDSLTQGFLLSGSKIARDRIKKKLIESIDAGDEIWLTVKLSQKFQDVANFHSDS